MTVASRRVGTARSPDATAPVSLAGPGRPGPTPTRLPACPRSVDVPAAGLCPPPNDEPGPQAQTVAEHLRKFTLRHQPALRGAAGTVVTSWPTPCRRRARGDPPRRRRALRGHRLTVAASVTEVNGHLVFGAKPKSHHARSVPIPRSLVDDLAAACAGERGEDLLFPGLGGGVLWLRNFQAASVRSGGAGGRAGRAHAARAAAHRREPGGERRGQRQERRAVLGHDDARRLHRPLRRRPRRGGRPYGPGREGESGCAPSVPGGRRHPDYSPRTRL